MFYSLNEQICGVQIPSMKDFSVYCAVKTCIEFLNKDYDLILNANLLKTLFQSAMNSNKLLFPVFEQVFLVWHPIDFESPRNAVGFLGISVPTKCMNKLWGVLS